MSIRRLLRLLPLVVAIALLVAGCGGGQAPPAQQPPASSGGEQQPEGETGSSGGSEPSQPVQIRFATGGQSTAWYAYGGAMRELLLAALPQGSQVEVLPRGLAIANVKMLDAGEAEIGFSFPPVVKWSQDGAVVFDKKVDSLRGLVGGIDTYYASVIVRKDLGITSLREVKERQLPIRIGSQPAGSQSELAVRHILEAYGLTTDDIQSFGGSVVATDLGVVADQFKDGQLDVIISVFTPGHPTFTDLALTTDLQFLNLDPEAIQYLSDKYGYPGGTMPANTFDKQTEPVRLLAFPTSLYAQASLPDEVAYAVTKAVVSNIDGLQQSFKSMKVLTREGAASEKNLVVPLHPGAERFYREEGLIR